MNALSGSFRKLKGSVLVARFKFSLLVPQQNGACFGMSLIAGAITSQSTPLAWRARLVCQVTSAKDGRFMALIFGYGVNGCPGLTDSSRRI